MKKLLIKLVLLLLASQNLFGQFTKMFYHASGFALSHGAAITHVARAGGGVVLIGIARPRHPDSLAVFTNITFDQSDGISTMNIQTSGLTISFFDSTWIMRDAAMLVKSERLDSMFRDVNLLGKFTGEEQENGLAAKHPSYKYFSVEIADSLRRTKSGQILILTDILLAGNKDTRYYSSSTIACDRYLATVDSLKNVVEAHNDSCKMSSYKSRNDIYLKLKNLDSLRKSGNLDSNESVFLGKIRQYSLYYLFYNNLGLDFAHSNDTVGSKLVDSLFNLDYVNRPDLKPLWNDYTYNDEGVNYVFDYSNEKHLEIVGEPHYTFLYNNGYDDTQVDSLFTGFFIEHPVLIKNLNSKVIEIAERFGRTAAFYRYLEKEYPKLWSLVYTHYLHARKETGETPRFIENNPE